MAQIKRKKTPGLGITGIGGSIILAIALCVVLASFAGFNQGKVVSFNPFQETPIRNEGDNPAPGLLWQGERVSLNVAIAATLTMAGRVPVKYTNSRCNTHIAHPLSVNAKFLGVIPSSVIGGADTTLTTADVCILLFIDIPPPYPKA